MKNIQKLLSLILVLSLLLSLASCGNRNNESSNESSQYVNQEEPFEVVYITSSHREAFDDRRKTLTREDYDKLWNAITNNSEVFPGTQNYYESVLDYLDLRTYDINRFFIDMMFNAHGNEPFNLEIAKTKIGDKFEVTDEMLNNCKSSGHLSYNEATQMYTINQTQPSEYKHGFYGYHLPYRYDKYLGYRDIGDNKYEFYFQATPMKVLNKEFVGSVGDKKELISTCTDGTVLYNGEVYIGYETENQGAMLTVPISGVPTDSTEFLRLDYASQLDDYKEITLECKDGKIKLVSLKHHYIDTGYGGEPTGKHEFLAPPYSYSKIPD